jgi:hypothetical protein
MMETLAAWGLILLFGLIVASLMIATMDKGDE